MPGGIKHDANKPRYDLLPAEALEELVRVYTFGCRKYSANNWRLGIEYTRLFSACQRHLWKFWSGLNVDEESGLHHLAHAAFSLLAILQYELEGRTELDDRFTKGRVKPKQNSSQKKSSKRTSKGQANG